jgi:hypothetical protein
MNQMKTLFKKAGLLCLFGLLAQPAHAVRTVQLDGPATVIVGGTFQIEVAVADLFDGLTDDYELTAFAFDVTVSDPAVAAFVGATVVSPPFATDPFAATHVAATAFPGVAFAVNLTQSLATLTFQALAAGNVSLGVTANIADINATNQGLVFFDTNTFAVTEADIEGVLNVVVTPAAMPVPATLTLFGLGLAGLATRRRCIG